MQRFNNLTSAELEELVRVPMYVGLMMAYADGTKDDKEEEWIEKVTFFRTKTAHHTLRPYYEMANSYIKANMKLFISELPKENDAILTELSKKIANNKPVLGKLDERMHERLVDSYKSMALSVAEISGGMLNFFASNPDEDKWLKWLDLEMLD